MRKLSQRVWGFRLSLQGGWSFVRKIRKGMVVASGCGEEERNVNSDLMVGINRVYAWSVRVLSQWKKGDNRREINRNQIGHLLWARP